MIISISNNNPMSKHKHKHKNKHKDIPKAIPKLNQIMDKRITIIILLALICIIGLPLRTQNMKLNGYISDDAWWHFRQINEVVQTGHRLNPDIFEFTTLSRPMTYPPLFHHLVASTYKFFKLFYKELSLITFSHYFNVLEGLLYILLIYWISVVISSDPLFSLIGALGASVAYGVIIRARAGELMAFVPSDLLALAGVAVLIYVLKDVNNRRSILLCALCALSGILFGLSTLAWSGAVLIYLPLALAGFLALIINDVNSARTTLKLFFSFLIPFLIIFSPWYLPMVSKYGINPHSKEMDWFMKNFTVSHQVKPLIFYIFTTGVPIFFVPIALLISFFRRSALNIFIILWILLCIGATLTGWRGYVAVGPIISCVAISIALSWIMRSVFKQGSILIPLIFIVSFLAVGTWGYYISALKLQTLNPNNVDEVRTNTKSIKMLEYLKQKYPQAITVDHISWISEDAAVGSLRMVGGQYLEYMPKGSSQALKDISKIYLSDEDNAYKLCQKYNVDLIIVRKQFLQLPQLSILFAPPELKSEDYLKIVKESAEASEMNVSFTPLGTQVMFFKMLNRQQLSKFELVYADQSQNDPLPYLVVYKVVKNAGGALFRALMREEGLEPSWVAPHASETCASAIPPPPQKQIKYILA